jgi:7,8-dihydroneopterin aldolase/epimerase/oxygenase
MDMREINIAGIKVFAHHGVLPEEIERGQEFLIDAQIVLEEGRGSTDELEATVDYATVAEALAGIATSTRYNLIETLAGELVDYLFGLDGVEAASVSVKKPGAPLPVEVDWVGVTASRGK